MQKRSGFDTTAYLGVGKRQEIRSFVNKEIDPDDFKAMAAQHACLGYHGCRTFQGYLFGKPVPGSEQLLDDALTGSRGSP